MTAQDNNRGYNLDNSPPDLQAERWQELIAGYVLGDLSSDERTEVQEYLASHPEAQLEVAELQATLNLLPLSLPEGTVPPQGLETKLLKSAAAIPQESLSSKQVVVAQPTPILEEAVPSVIRSSARSPWQSWISWGAIAATTAAAILGWQNLQLRNNLQLAQQRNERLAIVQSQLIAAQADVAEYQEMISMLRLPENRLLALSGAAGFTETSSGSVVIAPQRNWAVLTLKDLPDPPVGKAYQLWAMANGEKVYCVEFKPDQTGEVLVEIPVGNWAGTPMVSITLEDEGTIPTETSEMVMNGTVI